MIGDEISKKFSLIQAFIAVLHFWKNETDQLKIESTI